MPALEIICAIGAGFEKIDLQAARERGIVVTSEHGIARLRRLFGCTRNAAVSAFI